MVAPANENPALAQLCREFLRSKSRFSFTVLRQYRHALDALQEHGAPTLAETLARISWSAWSHDVAARLDPARPAVSSARGLEIAGIFLRWARERGHLDEAPPVFAGESAL